MSIPADENSDLSSFRNFVYGSYAETHAIYSDESAGNSHVRAQHFTRSLGRLLPADRSSRILDFGCGNGTLLSVAQNLGYTDLTGVERAKGQLERAAICTRAKLHLGDGVAFLLGCADETFDVIIAFDVIEHLTRPEILQTCRQMARTLKPGGILLLHVPNGASPYCGDILWGDITHEMAFTRASLRQVLEPLGFEKIEAEEDGPVPHGIKSTIRFVLWKIIRAAMILRLVIETGRFRGHILTICMFVVARKASRD